MFNFQVNPKFILFCFGKTTGAHPRHLNILKQALILLSEAELAQGRSCAHVGERALMGTSAQVHPALQETFWNMLYLQPLLCSEEASGKGTRERKRTKASAEPSGM